jgi:hypothetical protein
MENKMDLQHKSLSTEAMGALMMCLQKSILEQADIVPMLMDLKFKDVDGELFVLNPQNIRGYSKMKKAELVNALSGRNV